ncbi:caspase domain-containing protein [Thermodesulfobacteriota bacterium]
MSDKDVRDFAAFLKKQTKLFKNVHVTLLTNEKATRSAVIRELNYRLRRADKDDTVIIFLSGHGADDPNAPGEFFFLTHDADPEYLAADAVNMSRQWFVERLDCKRLVLIADACHAGGFSSKVTKALRRSRENLMKIFQESEGKVFTTSSRPDELSIEKPEYGNGLFTYYLLQGLGGEADKDREGVVALKELYDYVYKQTKADSDGYQSPQMEGRVVGAFPMSLV